MSCRLRGSDGAVTLGATLVRRGALMERRGGLRAMVGAIAAPLLVCAALLAPRALAAQEDGSTGKPEERACRLRWAFKKDARFEYSLSGLVVEKKRLKERTGRTETRTKARLFIIGESEERALLSVRYEEIRQREDGESFITPPAELEKLSVVLRVDALCRVVEKKQAGGAEEDLLASIFPLPEVPVKVGDRWRVKFEKARMAGSCEVAGWRRWGGRRCLLLKLSAARAEGGKVVEKMETLAYFDPAEGAFARVERSIERLGEESRKQFLVLVLEGSPSRPSRRVLAARMTKEMEERLLERPEDEETRCKLVRMLVEAGRAGEALEVAREKLKTAGPALMVAASEAALAVGETAAALRYAMGAMSKAPGDREAALAAARAAFAAGRWQQAAVLAKQALVGGKGPYQALYYLGAALARLGRRQEAREVLERFVKKSPHLDPKRKWVISFSPQGDVRILAERAGTADVASKSRYTQQELELGRRLLAVLVKEESVRMKLTAQEIEKMLDYMAGIYGKSVYRMLSDFLADRKQAFARLKELLRGRERVPADRLKGYLEKDDGDLAAAAVGLMSGDEVVGLYESLRKEHPACRGVLVGLLRLYGTNPGRFGGELRRILLILKNLEPENALWPLLLSWRAMQLREMKDALLWLVRARDRKDFRLGVAEEVRLRARILTETGFEKGLRRVAAWTMRNDLLERWVLEVLRGGIEAGRTLLNGGNATGAAKWADLVGSVAVVLEGRAETAFLYGGAAAVGVSSAELRADALMRGGEGDLDAAISRLAAERARARRVWDAYRRWKEDSERAFTVWVITEPEKCSTFLERLFKMGGRNALRERMSMEDE